VAASGQETFREEALTFAGAAGRLAGTLTVPAGPPRGAVLIIAGSGAVDRNGDVGKLRPGTYRELAQDVGRQGFMALRYDKRGVGGSPGDRYSIGLWDRVDDAQAAVRFLRERLADPRAPIVLMGHSEGCIIAVAANARSPVEGLVLLAGPCESLSATSARQQQQAIEDLRRMRGFGGLLVRLLRVPDSQARKAPRTMARILAAERPWVRISGVKMNARWIQEHFRYDVRSDLPQVRCPVLAITGAKDIQVLPEDTRRIAEAVLGPAQAMIIPDMTHMLRRTQETCDMISLMKLYRRLCREPVDQELLDAVRSWLDEHFPAQGSA